MAVEGVAAAAVCKGCWLHLSAGCMIILFHVRAEEGETERGCERLQCQELVEAVT